MGRGPKYTRAASGSPNGLPKLACRGLLQIHARPKAYHHFRKFSLRTNLFLGFADQQAQLEMCLALDTLKQHVSAYFPASCCSQ